MPITPRKEPPKFSQFDEEPILQKLLEGYVGRCSDIGARERRWSNVALLIDQGWEAQLIDRDPNYLLRDFPKRDYPKVDVVHCTVTAQNVNDVLWGGIDLLSIDIDGPDADVWDAIEQRPRFLVIEAMKQNRARIIETSKKRGYRLHAETGPNLIYVR